MRSILQLLNPVTTFVRRQALFLSMLLGVLIGLLQVAGLWTWYAPDWVLPSCIFLMLFFTFVRMNPLDLRFHKWHGVIFAFQLVVSMALYVAFRRVDIILAQGLFICVLMPSATAAPIIAGKLGGNILNLTAYTLFSNAITALLVPLLFPLVNPGVDLPFWASFVLIIKRIAPVLVGPFLSAWALRLLYQFYTKCTKHWFGSSSSPSLEGVRGCLLELPFILWTLTLVILMAKMTRDLSVYDGSLAVLAAMFVGSLVMCMMQFGFGKWIGFRMPVVSPDETKITAGQALGQKNTTLAIWLAATYLHPVSALAPAAYILWQNLFNSWQLAHRKG